ncbi:hypothetical protein PanWU01x14_150620, partial [Parasponia andersonii]
SLHQVVSRARLPFSTVTNAGVEDVVPVTKSTRRRHFEHLFKVLSDVIYESFT